MARITWISAVQEYNKRNNKKVKGRKNSKEYPAIKKLFEELKSGQTQRTAPKQAPKKSLKLKSGEEVNLQVKCEGGDVKVREVKEEKKREIKESREQKEEREFQERKAVRDKQNVEIIAILEKQKELETKYEKDEYYELSTETRDKVREKRIEKNRKQFKKLVEKLRPILKEIGLSDNPASMFEKRDYLTYEAFDIEKLPVSNLTYWKEEKKREEKEEKRRKAREAEEEKEYGFIEENPEFPWEKRIKEKKEREKKEKLKKMREEDVKEEAEIKELEGKVAEARKRRMDLEKKKKPAEKKREAPEEPEAPPKCKDGECKKRDIKSKMKRLRERCLADKVDKKDLDFSGEKSNKSINKKFERLKDLLSKDKNKDCEKDAEKKLKEATENKNKALQKPQEKPQKSISLTRYEIRFIKKLIGKMPPSPEEIREALEKRLEEIEKGEKSKTGIARRLEVSFENMAKLRDDIVIPKILKKL